MKNLNSFVCLIVGAVVLGGIRPFLSPGDPTLIDVYKSMAHIYVGILVGGLWYGKNKLCGYLALGLSVLEVICAVSQRL